VNSAAAEEIDTAPFEIPIIILNDDDDNNNNMVKMIMPVAFHNQYI